MRYERKEYEKAYSLPLGTMSVKNFAQFKGIKVASVYGQYIRKTIKIVEFEGYNFVLPEKITK